MFIDRSIRSRPSCVGAARLLGVIACRSFDAFAFGVLRSFRATALAQVFQQSSALQVAN